MTEPVAFWLIILLLLIVAGALYLGYYYLRENVWNPAGKGAFRRTGRILSRYALLRRFRVLSDLELNTASGTVTVEHALIGFFGILLVHTCGARGEYYGRPDGKDWVLVQEDIRKNFANPMMQQQEAIAALRPILAKQKLYNISIETALHFTNHSKKTQIFLPPDERLILGGKLKSYLERAKFDRDSNVDVEQIAALLEPYCKSK